MDDYVVPVATATDHGRTGWADPAVEENRTEHIQYWMAKHPLSIREKASNLDQLEAQL